MQGKGPHPTHTTTGGAIVWRFRALSLSAPPEGPGGPPPPLGCAVWLPREGEGEARSRRPSSGATSTVNQFT